MVYLHLVGYVCTGLVAAVLVAGGLLALFPRLNIMPWKWQFLLGGVFAQICHRLQDSIPWFDFRHADPTPEEILRELETRTQLVQTHHHHHCSDDTHDVPLLLVGCMDRLIDWQEVLGDSRHIAYRIRVAGSILTPVIFEMIELVIRKKGVKVVVFTTHSGCAAESVASDPRERPLYPNMSAAIDERAKRLSEFVTRPFIAQLIRDGKLIVRQFHLDTKTHGLMPIENSPESLAAVAN